MSAAQAQIGPQVRLRRNEMDVLAPGVNESRPQPFRDATVDVTSTQGFWADLVTTVGVNIPTLSPMMLLDGRFVPAMPRSVAPPPPRPGRSITSA
jgi:hypothetical protein